LIVSHQYDADGLPRSIRYGDAAATHADFEFDPTTRILRRFSLSRVEPSVWRNPFGAYQPPAPGDPPTQQTILEDLQFGYDDVDNLTAIQDLRDACAWPAGAKPVTRRATHDDLYRLLRVDYDYGGPGACSSATDAYVAPFASDPSASAKAVLPWQTTPNRIRQ